jgi:hypothetical protein
VLPAAVPAAKVFANKGIFKTEIAVFTLAGHARIVKLLTKGERTLVQVFERGSSTIAEQLEPSDILMSPSS